MHRLALRLVLAAIAVGCRNPPPATPRTEPWLGPHTLTTERRIGGLLDVARTAAAARGADELPAEATRDVAQIEVALFALATPLDGGRPLATGLRLGADLMGATALTLAGPLSIHGRFAGGEEAEAWLARLADSPARSSAPIGSYTELVPRGATLTVSFAATRVEQVGDDFLNELSALGPYTARLDLLLAFGERGIEVGVASRDRDRAARPGDAAAAPPLRRSEHGAVVAVPAVDLRRDLAVLDAPLVRGGPPLVVVVPSPLGGGRAEWIAFACRHTAAEPSEPERIAARERYAGEGRDRAPSLAIPDESRAAESRALAAIRASEGRRPALLFLADGRGARFAAELALVAGDDLLETLAAELDRLAIAPAPELGWQLERAALRVAAAEAARATLAPEVSAALLRLAGHAGAFPGLLDEIAAESADLAAFEARLVAENEVFLEDSDPAARVRAFDWLAARGLAPEGFDPLREDRR